MTITEAVLEEARSGGATGGVTVVLEGDRVFVEVRDESAGLNAEEARRLADHIEHVASQEGWFSSEARKLVMLLRTDADALEDELS